MNISCPGCGHAGVLRVPSFALWERCAEWFRLSPFRCRSCHQRFHAWRTMRRGETVAPDRRQHRRIPVKLALSFSGGRIRGVGTALDMSMGGCVVESETIVQANDIYYLELSLEDGRPPIEVAAMVRFVRGRRIGFQFLRSARDHQRLFDFLHANGA